MFTKFDLLNYIQSNFTIMKSTKSIIKFRKSNKGQPSVLLSFLLSSPANEVQRQSLKKVDIQRLKRFLQ